MPRFTAMEPKLTAYEAPRAFERPYYDQKAPAVGFSATPLGSGRWAMPVRPPPLGPVKSAFTSAQTRQRPVSAGYVRPMSAGAVPRSARRLQNALSLDGRGVSSGPRGLAPTDAMGARGLAPPDMMAIGVSPRRVDALQQQNEVLQSAYGGVRTQLEAALRALKSAEVAKRDQAARIEQAEERAAKAEKLIHALTTALVRSERDSVVVVSELRLAEKALEAKQREEQDRSHDVVTAAVQVIADALGTPGALRGGQAAPATPPPLPYGQGVLPAEALAPKLAVAPASTEAQGAGNDAAVAQETVAEPVATPAVEATGPPAVEAAAEAAQAEAVVAERTLEVEEAEARAATNGAAATAAEARAATTEAAATEAAVTGATEAGATEPALAPPRSRSPSRLRRTRPTRGPPPTPLGA